MKTFLRHRGQTIEVIDTIVMGRSSKCGLVLDDEMSSRQHCRVEVRGDRAVLVDLGSMNGVLVNGKRVTGERELHHGDLIAIGASQIVLLRQAGAPREEHRSQQHTQPDAADDPRAWHAMLDALARAGERALSSGDRSGAEASARSLFASATAVAARTPLDPVIVGRAVELGLALTERYGDRYFVDRVIALHLVARAAMTPDVASRILRASAPLAAVVDDYLAASARIEGMTAEARQHLALVGYLREAVTGDVRAHDAALAARDALRTAILSRTTTSAPASAPNPWSVLVDESWLLLDQFDHAGRRYVVACKRLDAAAPSERLDEQERRVAALLARGEANKAIAYELELSRSRAANIVTEIKRKLGVASRSEAVLLLRWAYAARNPSA